VVEAGAGANAAGVENALLCAATDWNVEMLRNFKGWPAL
jgi:hypothetical protein